MLFLETFISNLDVGVRRSLIASMTLDPGDYSPSHRPLIERAIQIARNAEDDYIRHRVEVKLGEMKLLKPLPQLDTPETKPGFNKQVRRL